MTGTRSHAEMQAREQLAILGLSFRLDDLRLSDGVYLEIAKMAENLVKYVRYDAPEPPGCAVFIDQMRLARNLGGWVTGFKNVDRPYWLPKIVLNELRQLEDDLDVLTQLKFSREEGWRPYFRFRGGENS